MNVATWVLLCLGLALMLTPAVVPMVLPKPDLQAPSGSPQIAGRAYATAPPLRSLRDPRVVRELNEPPLAFVRRTVESVHSATYHCAYDTVWHSWLTGFLGDDIPGLSDYGILSLKYMRCGYCHQRAFLLAEALRHGGIADVAVLGLGAHVVTTFSIDGASYAADADYGVGPVPLSGEAAATRRALEAAYEPVRRDFGETVWRTIVDLYSQPEGHRQYHYGTLLRLASRQEQVLSLQGKVETAIVGLGGALWGVAGITAFFARRRRRALQREIGAVA